MGAQGRLLGSREAAEVSLVVQAEKEGPRIPGGGKSTRKGQRERSQGRSGTCKFSAAEVKSLSERQRQTWPRVAMYTGAHHRAFPASH